MTIDKSKLAELIAKARASAIAKAAPVPEIKYEYLGTEIDKPEFDEMVTELVTDLEEPAENEYTTAMGKVVTLNEQQLDYVNRVCAGESVVMIGKAGTGKTTGAGVGMTEAIKRGHIKPMRNATKWLQVGLPGVAVLSFTNKATNNIRHQMPADIQPHTITLHKLLEFKPVKYEVEDKETGEWKITMRFEPSRNAYNPLPSDLKMIVIEEASMVSVELHQLLKDAMPHEHQIIYLGDIRQLPPVMGTAILGFKMLELPIVELTEVYRQALLSPILRLALSIDSGEATKFNGDARITDVATKKFRWPVLEKWNESGEYGSVKIHPWQKALSPDLALMTAIKFMNTLADQSHDLYNPQEDIILTPYNKSFGTVELNKGIAQHLGRKRGAVVHEVIAGFQKHYLAVGDRVLYNKEDAFITAIAHNDEYMGKRPQHSGSNLNRWGHYAEVELSQAEKDAQAKEAEDFELTAIENFLESSAAEIEDRVTAASHCVSIRYAYADEDDDSGNFDLDKSVEINNILGGYAITVHKAQGSEYDKVFLLLHSSQNTMISRELLYTACTRAAKHLYIICEPNSLTKGINSQRIKGNTLAEKAEYFKGKMDQYLEATGGSKDRYAKIEALKAEVTIAINQSIQNLNAHYPNKPPVSIKEVTYVDKGDAAGTAYLGGGIVNINPLYLEWDKQHVLVKTVPHEVAHIFAYEWFRDTGHGTAWKQLCIEAGGTGEIYHDMGKAIGLRKLDSKSKR